MILARTRIINFRTDFMDNSASLEEWASRNGLSKELAIRLLNLADDLDRADRFNGLSDYRGVAIKPEHVNPRKLAAHEAE